MRPSDIFFSGEGLDEGLDEVGHQRKRGVRLNERGVTGTPWHMVGFTYGGLFPFLEVDIQYLPLLWGASPGLVGVLSQA